MIRSTLIFTILSITSSWCVQIPYISGFFDQKSSHENLKYFEKIHSSSFSHRIVKRGLSHSDHPLNKIEELTFNALGREFKLILNPRKGLFHHYFKAYVVNENGTENLVTIDHETFYEGRLFGEKSSKVSAHFEDDILTATIFTDEDTYHVEPAWRHVSESTPEEMIVYRGSDVKNSFESKPSSHQACHFVKEGYDSLEEATSDWLLEDSESREESLVRVKRQEASAFNGRKTRCPLLLVADYRFFREMGASNYKTTINYIISLIDRVDNIYENIAWGDDIESEEFSGMGFVIKKIVVHQTWNPVSFNQQHYNMKSESWEVQNLLEVFSREHSHKDYCLAHLFTDIQSEGGIQGLAYVGSPRISSVGGICSEEYFKNGHTLYLNSGLSSSRNRYGQRVITREADLVTAHEFGHNWGSEHDPDQPECSPSASRGGSYLMNTYSVSGYDINNKLFSPCSLRAIRAVLMAKSSLCFTEPEASHCGNQRVEGKEDCDAGLVGQGDGDLCCDKQCKLRSGAVCSNKNSPCCNNDCNYMDEGIVCREEQSYNCELESRCTGKMDSCPKPEAMRDGTDCIEMGTCKEGKCIPYCETQDMQSCMCDTIKDACKRCCRKAFNDTCFAIQPEDILPNGTPCIRGFCKEGACENTVQDVVARIWHIIEDININTLLVCLRDNLVIVVITISAIIWIPAACIYSYVDRKREAEYVKQCKKYDHVAFAWRSKALTPRYYARGPDETEVLIGRLLQSAL